MFEQLLSSGVAYGQVYPLSGPGPKTLRYGNTGLGYFGRLSSSEFLTATNLLNQLDIMPNEPNDSDYWLKLYLDDKVIYMPESGRLSSVSWDTLYAAGAIYGDNTIGQIPGTPNVVQNATIGVQGYAFKVRGPRSDTATKATSMIWTATSTVLSDMRRILTALITTWKLYPDNTGLIYSQGSIPTLTTATTDDRFVKSITNGTVQMLQKTSVGYWSPVLELIPPDQTYIFPMKPVEGLAAARAEPVSIFNITYNEPFYKMYGIRFVTQSARAVIATTEPGSAPVLRIQRSNIKLEINPVTAVTTTTVTYA